ncbi:L-ribulose-5-phosphate 3-epimerase [Helcococcus ovis]|uniref:L-ribulose-5-phosphate 3-epimerase n=1 Tax=Helcococcus ovis TaxID=72026 RepID=UPI00106F31D2|nr:L-ribulose-5-phosphate 3-epimerase [Helcococcus ovis]TFF66518.1 L-ribulose-5-phosphate 3-epimerase [Helcococcus ovis]WNZ01675.1 L-ribulose-5-phosphate 3-epimerase [Helcococcus ovis]
MKYQLGLYEKALPSNLTWEEKFNIAKSAGYDFLEISIDETDEKLSRLDWTKEEINSLISIMQKTDFPIRSMCLSGHRKYPLGSLNEQTRLRSIMIAEKAINLADKLGIRIIQLAGYDVYYEKSNDETKKLFEVNLRKMVEMASAKGILLGFETMETEFMDTVSKAMEYVEKINSPYLGVYPDCGNLNNVAIKYDRDILDDIDAGVGKILAFHIKETVPGKYRDMHFGEGDVDFDKICKKLYELKINRFVTEFWHLGEDNYIEIVNEQCKFAKNVLAKYYN